MLVSLPSLTVGLLLDDLLHRLVLSGQFHDFGQWNRLGLYEFVGTATTMPAGLREGGLLPWWTPDTLSVRFFRPLPSALLILDTKLFGEAPFPAHLHSLLWFLAMVSVVGWLHKRLLPVPLAAVATVAYAVAAAHLMPVAWIASRHPLVSGVPGLLALAFHLRAREDGWRPGLFLGPLLFVIALLGGEPALSAVALIGAYELFGRREGLRRAAPALAPYVFLVAAYLAFYVARGYGARGSAAYLDPARAPGTFVTTVAQRVLILLADLVVATPSDAAASVPPLHPAFALWGALVTIGALVLLRFLHGRLSEQERRTLRWLLPGGLAAVVPGAVGVIGGRVLMIPLLAGSALVAVLLVRSWQASREAELSRWTRTGLRVAVVLLVWGHFFFGPLFRMALGVALGRIADAQWSLARSAPPCDGTLVMVAAADPTIATYVPAAMALTGRAPHRYRLLSAAPHDHYLERTSANGFDLVVHTEERKVGFWEQVYRDVSPAPGTQVQLSGLRITVKESTEAGPMRVHFDFDRPLESPDLCFMTWHDGALRVLALPPPGQGVSIPHELGPMGL
ncbi:hypothetical protein JY651_14725 [Pyxidicoccus parkwayensis]|uniref:Glycosyltransferase RgtA/B/C/D-like domain-containing protein n=1 Tax=Pyxidicoccus parkwayensis TaxID=2813578 RepID=A0ABX7P6L8_9BACT|nr:hypothetical protein [Pyxidicoccus parkwaysis]QSQ26099.1 hypothetical protein JY651_14725 [Pyxidicoccus parkwaysis]